MAKETKLSISSPERKRMLGARIDERLARLLKSNAARKGVSVQELLEQLVRQYLQKEGELK